MERYIVDIITASALFNEKTVIRAKTTTHIDLMKSTDHLPSTYLPRQRLWHIINESLTPPTCKMCSNTVRWDSTQPTSKQKYRDYCSHKCEHGDPTIQLKKQNTEISRYGIGRPTIVAKIKDTNMERYGETHAIKLKSYQDKQKTTNITRYGVGNVSLLVDTLNKRTATLIDKYNTISYAQQHFGVAILDKINDAQWLLEQHITLDKSITEIATDLGINYEVVTRGLKRYDIPIKYHGNDSSPERQLVDFVKTLTSDIVTSDRNIIHPQHLDIVIPSKQVAIEFNGIYWHSELQGRGRSYHLTKTEQCYKKGIQLLHVFEDEWYNKRDIVKSIISNKLGCSARTIYARKCKIVNVDKQQCSHFIDTNHIQGSVNNTVRLGLMYNGELVCIMTFSKSRYSKHQYEMYRFCNIIDTHVVGGASRLFKHFINQYNPTSIVSYSDKRWSTGDMYNKLGFTHLHDSAPNYKYFLNGTMRLLSRIKFQKHKLRNILEKYDAALSEWDNMQSNKYNRIWDCGNGVWVWMPII
jgi:hypothetical protein